MKKPAFPSNEAQRLQSLLECSILDTPAEDFFDKLTQLAASICGTEFAAVSLVDEKRQWFKSRVGFDQIETHRDISFCGHTILQDQIFEVPDALQDSRFADNPLVTHDLKIRYYAGVPLLGPQGLPLGTLCVFDKKVRVLEEFQARTLESLAKKISRYIAEK